MAQKDEAGVRQRLTAERTRLEQEMYDRTEGDQAVVPTDPLLDSGGVPGHQADDADAVSDFERNQAIITNARAVLAQVNAALERLDAGTYGTCARCGKAIPARRLEALPYATYDVECQEIVEREAQGRR